MENKKEMGCFDTSKKYNTILNLPGQFLPPKPQWIQVFFVAKHRIRIHAPKKADLTKLHTDGNPKKNFPLWSRSAFNVQRQKSVRK